MYELCRLLASKKTPKARKPSAPSQKPVKIGARVMAAGPGEGVVIGYDEARGWWNVEFTRGDERAVWGFNRKLLKVID